MREAHTAAIVVAGGTGERLGLPGGKQLALVGGLPVLSWTVAAFEETPGVDLIVVVAHPDRVEEYRRVAIEPLGLSTTVRFAGGGDTRQLSVACGLAMVPDCAEVVVVHDGARPLVTPELTTSLLQRLMFEPSVAGVVVGHSAVDTLKIVGADQIVLTTPDRSQFWAVQTPQVFRAGALREAYSRAAVDGFLGTDDASLVERTGGRILVVEGPRDNIKVTVAEDIVLVEAALEYRRGGRRS